MSKFNPIAVAFVALISFTALAAHADAGLGARVGSALTADGAFAGRSAAVRGDRGAMAGRRGVVADGQGNVSGAAARGFATSSGAQGQRSRTFDRASDGSIDASGQTSGSGTHGSTERSGSFARSADGSASGERSTTATNADSGVTYTGSTRYNKGSGVTRSVSCMDAAGDTFACGSR